MWIDGKPIFRKVIQAANVANGTRVAHGCSIAQLVRCLYVSGNHEALPLYPGDAAWGASARCSATDVIFSVGPSYGGIARATVILEYTKL